MFCLTIGFARERISARRSSNCWTDPLTAHTQIPELHMKGPIYLAVLVGTFLSPGLFAADKRAKTEDGKDVILRDDGTWYYVDQAKKDKEAKEIYKGKRGTFILSMAPGVWRKSEEHSSPVTQGKRI
jgi:hypothetical protein